MPLQPVRTTLTRRALIRMGLRIAAVILLITLAAYWHFYASLEDSLRDGLRNYVQARADGESEQFLLAETQTKMIANEYLRRLALAENTDPRAQFNALFAAGKDGVVRVRPEVSDYQHKATLFIRNDVPLTPEFQRRVVTAWQLLTEWGPLTTNRFLDSFINMPEQMSLNYAPFVDWSQSTSPATNIYEYETVWRSTAQSNPSRRPFWTTVYFDDGAHKWMISHVTPADYKGRWVGTAGQDIVIDDLVHRTANDHLAGTYNVIVRSDGQLIAHPRLGKEIQLAGGKLDVSHLHDPELQSIVRTALSVTANAQVVETSDGKFQLGVGRIHGPDWRLIVVYPSSRLSSIAGANARYVLILGALSLLVELLILWSVLRKLVAEPLSELAVAEARVADGNYDISLPSTQRNDEFGRVARGFEMMVRRVGERDRQLVQAAGDLAREAETARITATRLAGLSQILPDPVFVVDANSVVQDAFGNTTRLFEGDPVGHSIFHTMPNSVIDGGRMALEIALQSGRAQRMVYEAELVEGERWFEALILPLPQQNNAHVLWLVRDITALKLTEGELRNARDHLQDIVAAQTADLRGARDRANAANRAKTQFVSNISHELRTPMHAILSFARIGQDKAETAKPEKLRRYFDNIIQSGERLLGMVNDLLDIAKLESGKMDYHLSQHALGRIIEGVITELEPLASRKRISLVPRVPPDDLLDCDASRVAQVLRNLVSNAIRFSPEDGEIAVTVYAEGDLLVTLVENDGPAIAQDDLERIFEKFVQGSGLNTPGSSGLGLAICREIVEAHGGVIVAANREEGGARFRFTLPRQQPAPPEGEHPLAG
ncbi:ATP-binding protein [Silvimonas soli]|uniref:sensor histidine kinase n=1 Tax=Silvimonas soli TaxID=2980100 RepID=UPI0024B33DA1|nr:ATP-binding protein [Silvimonas soli]